MKMSEEDKKLHVEAFDEAIHNLEVLEIYAQNLYASLILRQKADGIKKEESDASKTQTDI